MSNRKRIFHLRGEIDVATAAAVMRLCRANEGVPILIEIDSPGGCFDSSWAIHDKLRSHGQAIAYVSGECCSGAMLAIAGCRLRTGSSGSRFMLHQTREVGPGNVRSHFSDQVMGILIARGFRKPDSVVSSWINATGKPDRETWFTASEAKRAGLIDRVGNSAGELFDDDGRLLYLSGLLSSSTIHGGDKKERMRQAMEILSALPKMPASLASSPRQAYLNKILSAGGNIRPGSFQAF